MIKNPYKQGDSMRRLPASPSRSQALVEFEPILLRVFEDLTATVNCEVKDAMHYALFSVEDRFCATAAWLLAPRLGIETSRLSTVLCAAETIRCSLLFKARAKNAFEPTLAEAASYGLIPLGFEIVAASKQKMSTAEQIEVMRILARAASPAHLREKVSPVFRAVGEILALFATTKEKAEILPEWFSKLGLFAHSVDEFTSNSDLELIKTVETELLEDARELRIQGAAHEIIEPLADTLKVRLQ